MALIEIVNLLLGGGMVATIASVLTLRSTMRKASGEAERAVADAERVRIDNAESATRILVENIVAPLRDALTTTREDLCTTRDELKETKKEFGATKREMARLRKAVEGANTCRFNNTCPVLAGLRDNKKEPLRASTVRTARTIGQYHARNPPSDDEDDTSGESATGTSRNPPP